MKTSSPGMQKRNPSRRAVRGELARAAAILLTMSLGVSRVARGDVASCAQSHASGQREAKAGHLKAASDLFASCGSDEGCPNPIRKECVEFYAEVRKHMPTVIFTVVDARGKDVTNVRVYSGEQLLADGLDGLPIAVDPGKHPLRFVVVGGSVLNSDVLVREGEKNRVVSVRMQDGAQTLSPVAPSTVNEQGDSGEGAPIDSASGGIRTSLPASFWVSAGVGAAALASWGLFALLGRNQQSKLNECSPNCAPSLRNDYDGMRRDYLIADVSLGVAIAAAGAATWFFLNDKRPSSASDGQNVTGRGARVSVVPLVSATGAGLVISSDAL